MDEAANSARESIEWKLEENANNDKISLGKPGETGITMSSCFDKGWG
jgi:hypothetical protein